MSEPTLYELSVPGRTGIALPACDVPEIELPEALLREDNGLPELSQLDVVRHYLRLSQRNFGVDSGFYPLGSCTMKYSPKLNERIARLPGFADTHPMQGAAEVQGNLAVLYELVVDDVPTVAGTALFVVFLLSWLDLRRVGRAVWTVSALAAGMCWAAAGMVTMGIELSVVNFVGIPILMGIGVDVIIHLMHRVEEEGPGRVAHALSTTGWASVLSAAAAMISRCSSGDRKVIRPPDSVEP